MKKILIISIGIIILIIIITIISPGPEFISFDDVPELSIASEIDYMGRVVYQVEEARFITQISEINNNKSYFNGQLVRIEGFVHQFEDLEGNIRTSVSRNVPACCTEGETRGFILNYNGKLPDVNEWVEVMGILILETINYNMEVLVIDVERVILKEVRGLEFVDR